MSPTRRGKRGGQHKTRFWDSCSGVNASNLVEISTKTNNLPVSTRHSFTIGCVNPRSIRNKLETFKDHVIDNSIDICAVTETWLKTEDDFIRDSLNMNGYVFKDVCRLNRTGGGTALLFKSAFTLVEKNGDQVTSRSSHVI